MVGESSTFSSNGSSFTGLMLFLKWRVLAWPKLGTCADTGLAASSI